jgi:hypothetical protein
MDKQKNVFVVKYVILITIFVLTFSSCGALGFYKANGLLNRGKFNVYEQYIPKKPKFKLKDRKDHIIVQHLDTIHIYSSTEYVSGYAGEYINFIKFYPAGRFLMIWIRAKDDINVENSLREMDLNPQNSYLRKGYYYSIDGKQATIEQFIGAQDYSHILGIYGYYSYSQLLVNPSGDTLTVNMRTYVKNNIPEEWKKYDVDW